MTCTVAADATRLRGFTLIEVVAALTIVGAVLVTLIAAVGGDLRASQRVRDSQQITAATELILERLRLRSREELRKADDRWRRLAPPPEHYRWRADISKVVAEPGLLEVTLHVQRVEGDEEIILVTRVFRPEKAAQ